MGCTTHWRLTNNFLLPELTAWRTFRTRIGTYDQLVPILLLVPKSLLHGIPITATAQDLYNAQYLQPHKIPHRPNDKPPLKQNKKKSSTLHHIAILVPHEELVMKSYMHERLAIAEAHYHNLNANIKNQDYWLLTSSVGIKIQKALNCSTGLNTVLFAHILHTSSLQNGTK